MPADPLVSVVLPTYNRARLLPRSIGSVLAQGYPNLELIVADDCSTDDTEAVVRSFADPRVRYLRCPRNGGPGYARNRGIEVARGDFIAFQDSDDEWLTDKLDRQVALLQKSPPEVGMVCGAYVVWLGDDRLDNHPLSASAERGDFEPDLLYGFRYTPPTWLLRRECLLTTGPFDESLPNREDWDLMFRVMPRWRLRGVHEPVIVQYRTADSVDKNFKARVSSYTTLLERYEARWAGAPKLKAHQWYELSRAQRSLNQYREARGSLRRALSVRPFWIKAMAAWVVSLFGQRWFYAAQRLYQKIARVR